MISDRFIHRSNRKSTAWIIYKSSSQHHLLGAASLYYYFPFTGMVTRDFKGITSIQEVECLGGGLRAEVKLLSLKLYTLEDNGVVASLNVIANTCLTYTDYSSCSVDTRDTHKSRLRLLVHDLEEGESREYGCRALALHTTGDESGLTWSILVTRKSK